MKAFTHSKSRKHHEHFGEEFSVLNSNNSDRYSTSKTRKSNIHIIVLYVLSIISIVCWIISLKILPFGHLFQFLLGAVILIVNFLVIRFTKSEF